MIKITEIVLKDKPCILVQGANITMYPYRSSQYKLIFDPNSQKEFVTFEIRNINSKVINLVSTHNTDKMGKLHLTINVNDVNNGFWWYDMEKDTLNEIDTLFENLLFDK